MGLTTEQMSSMTLADAEAVASRLEGAARTIRESLAMLGGAPPVQSAPRAGPACSMCGAVGPHTCPFEQRAAQVAPSAVLVTNKGPVRLTDEEIGQRDALRREREAEELAADRRKLSGE